MVKVLSIFVFICSIAVSNGGTDRSEQTQKPKLLRDGFVLAGVDGKLIGSENEQWYFQFAGEVSDDKGQITPGQSVRLLACSTLEKMATAAKDRTQAGYRLWGRVTQFENENFIFPIYFLPLSEVEPEQAEQQKSVKIIVNEPNDVVVIPEDVVQMLKPKRTINLAQLEKGLTAEEDGIFADRTGFFIKQKNSEWFSFELDALGRKLGTFSFRLLPCQTLEKAWAEQQESINPLRYKVAGILTKYDGVYYLLLQRAVRTYNHGNFSR